MKQVDKAASQPSAKNEKDAANAGYTRDSFLDLIKRAIKTPALKPATKAK
jgi:hypothetical protein